MLLGCVGLVAIGSWSVPWAVGMQTAHGQASAKSTTIDEAISLLAETQRRFQAVQDYECTLVKRERVGGRLLPVHVMTVKVRNDPLSVSIRWQAPQSKKGQEVCYFAGKNNGKMRVHLAGLLGIIGFVSVEPLDPRVQGKSPPDHRSRPRVLA